MRRTCIVPSFSDRLSDTLLPQNETLKKGFFRPRQNKCAECVSVNTWHSKIFIYKPTVRSVVIREERTAACALPGRGRLQQQGGVSCNGLFWQQGGHGRGSWRPAGSPKRYVNTCIDLYESHVLRQHLQLALILLCLQPVQDNPRRSHLPGQDVCPWLWRPKQ